MKQLLALSLVVAAIFTSAAQRGHSPRLYYLKFNQELNLFRHKSMDFFEANLTDGDPVTTAAKFEEVRDHLRDSKKRIAQTHAFNDSPALKEEYLSGIDSLIVIFESHFEKILQNKPYRNESYANLSRYYAALSTAEEKIKKVEERLLMAEEAFASANRFSITRDSEDEKKYRHFQKINNHSRTITLWFCQVDQQIEEFITTVKMNPNMNLETFALESRVEKLQTEVEHMLTEVEDLETEGLNPVLKEDMTAYLKMIRKDLRKSLSKIAGTLDEAPHYSNECQDARIDLRYFEQDYSDIREKFLESRMTWLKGAFKNLQS